MEPLLSLTNITKSYPGVVANRGVSLSVLPGEIHGLLGENGAGKSTLMNIVSGMVEPDSGAIHVAGTPVALSNAVDAKRAGIGMVHQHFMLVPTMTVAENVALGVGGGGSPLSHVSAISARVAEVSSRYGLEVNPGARVSKLAVGERQRVEIVRMLFHDPCVLILDEPTAVLTPQEWRELARVMRELAADGRAIVFITHKLDELMAVADRCTVMRDGVVVRSVDVADTSKQELAELMVGRQVVLPRGRGKGAGAPVLEVRQLGLDGLDGLPLLDAISFSIGRGEILGVAGVDGNGQEQLVQTLIGMTPASRGEIWMHGKVITNVTPADFIARGGAVVHSDRHHLGLALGLSIRDNLMMAEFATSSFAHRGWLRSKATHDRCAKLMREYDIRAPNDRVLLGQLSGGNQQKVVLAREMGRSPKLLIASQPTRGLDIGAVEFVYGRLQAHREAGGATLLVSTELDEILALADRIAVISAGRFAATLPTDEATPERLGLLMAGAREAA